MATQSFAVATERKASGETGEQIRVVGRYMLHGEIGMSAAGEALVDTPKTDDQLLARVTTRAGEVNDASDPYVQSLQAWLTAARSNGIYRARNRQGNWYA